MEYVEQLKQLLAVTADGDLLSKDARDRLVKQGLVKRWQGLNFLSKRGIKVALALRLDKRFP